MNKPAFNFISEQQASLQSCTLVIELNLQYFYYVVLNESNAVVALKYYQFSKKDISETVSLLDEIIKEDEILQGKMKACAAVYNWPENCLVPDKYFNIDHTKAMIELIHGDAKKGSIFSEQIQGYHIYNVYRIPNEVHELLQGHFPNIQCRHHYTAWLKSQQKDNLAKDRLSIIFYVNEIVTAVFASGHLQAIQSLKYQAPEDIAFYLLHICKHFNLKHTETLLQISGMIDKNSAMYEELLKYFLLVEADDLSGEFTMAGEFEPYPKHFFSPLLKLAACAL